MSVPGQTNIQACALKLHRDRPPSLHIALVNETELVPGSDWYNTEMSGISLVYTLTKHDVIMDQL